MCSKKLQIVYFLVSLCFSYEAISQMRSPANYAPDDDIIIAPLMIENKNFIDDIYENKKLVLDAQKAQVQRWQSNEEQAELYGLENALIYSTISPEEKRKYVERNFLRFVSKHIEDSTRTGISDAIDEWNADDEIASIDRAEQVEEKIDEYRKANGRGVQKNEQEVNVGKKSFKFGMQTRLEVGMVKFTFQSEYFNARAWVGVASGKELKIDRRFKSTGTYAMANYYLDEDRIIASLDQPLWGNWSLRFSHTKTNSGEGLIGNPGIENNIFQIRFGMKF